MKGPRANLTTAQAVMSDHGGELTFWLAWLSEELDPGLCDWFRAQARMDPALRKSLESVDHPASREQMRSALEAINYLTPRDGKGGMPGVEPLTGFALKEGEEDTAAGGEFTLTSSVEHPRASRPGGDRELYRRVSRSLFLLLTEVEVPLPATDEAREATALLHHLVGFPAVDRFRKLDRWLNEVRLRASKPAPHAIDRVLHWLTPEFFQSDSEGFLHHLSFRLYLRSRLRDYCRQRGWTPAGPRYHDLSVAFCDLERDRIGQLVYQAIEESEVGTLEQARVSPRQVLQWLTVAP